MPPAGEGITILRGYFQKRPVAIGISFQAYQDYYYCHHHYHRQQAQVLQVTFIRLLISNFEILIDFTIFLKCRIKFFFLYHSNLKFAQILPIYKKNRRNRFQLCEWRQNFTVTVLTEVMGVAGLRKSSLSCTNYTYFIKKQQQKNKIIRLKDRLRCEATRVG